MESWNNDKVVEWIADKGFGVWTPYFKVVGITGAGLSSISLDELIEAKIDKAAAKKIIHKRDRDLKKYQSYTNLNRNQTTKEGSNSDSDSSSFISPTTVKRFISGSNTITSTNNNTSLSIIDSKGASPPTYSSQLNSNFNSLNNSAGLNSFLAQSVGSSTGSTSLASSYDLPSTSIVLPSSSIQISSTAIGTSPQTDGSGFLTTPEITPRGIAVESQFSDHAEAAKKRRGKKNKLGKYFMKKEKKTKDTTIAADYDHDGSDSSPNHSADDLSDGETDGVGMPYNVAHKFHVEFHADIGFTGLPLEWKIRFEDEARVSQQRLSPYPLTWSVVDVGVWLGEKGFGVYARQFKEENVDGKRLVMFISDTLRSSFPKMSEKHALAIAKQIDILKGSFPKVGGPKVCKVFGVALDTVLQSQQSSYPDLEIPFVLHKLFNLIREEGMNQVGIFRIGPSVAHMQEIRDKIDDAMDVCLSDFQDCVIPTSLIKLYFRELPHPVITHEAYIACIAALSKDIAELKRAIETLPVANYSLLKHTLQLLYDVSKHKDTNQMGADNLAKVFGPTLLWQNTIAGGLEGNPLALVQKATEFVETCICSVPVLFLSDAPPEVKQFRETLPLQEGPFSPPPNSPQPAGKFEEPEFAELLNYAEAAEVPEFDPVTKPQFCLEDMGDSSYVLANSAMSTHSNSASVLSFRGDETSSEASFETVILAPSESDDKSWTFSEGIPDSPNSQSSRGSFYYNSASSYGMASSVGLSSSISSSTDSLNLEEFMMANSRTPDYTPPVSSRDYSSEESFNSQTIERERSNSKDQSPQPTERERSNSKEQPTSIRSAASNVRDRANFKDQSSPTLSRYRPGANKDQSIDRSTSSSPYLLSSPASVRDRSNSKEATHRGSPREVVRGSPRDRANSHEVGISPREAVVDGRPSPIEIISQKDNNAPFTLRVELPFVSPTSPHDPPTPRGISKPQENPTPLPQSLIPPPHLVTPAPPHLITPPPPQSLVPPPHLVTPSPAPTSSSVSVGIDLLQSESTSNSPLPAVVSTLSPLPPPSQSPLSLSSQSPLSLPSPLPVSSHGSFDLASGPLLRRLTILVSKDSKKQSKDKEKNKEKRDDKSDQSDVEERDLEIDNNKSKADKKREKEERKKQQKEEKKQEEKEKKREKKEKRKQSKEVGDKDKERSRILFSVPLSPFSLSNSILKSSSSSILKRSASAGVVFDLRSESREKRSATVSHHSLIDP